MKVAPANAALLGVEQAFAGRGASNALVVTDLFGVVVQFERDHVEVEVVANHALHEEGVQFLGPILFRHLPVGLAQSEVFFVV